MTELPIVKVTGGLIRQRLWPTLLNFWSYGDKSGERSGANGEAGKPIAVFLLDDHEVVRRGVRDLLEAEPDIQVVGEAGTAS